MGHSDECPHLIDTVPYELFCGGFYFAVDDEVDSGLPGVVCDDGNAFGVFTCAARRVKGYFDGGAFAWL